MKKVYFAKVLTALLLSALACMVVQAETMDNYPIDKSPYYGRSPLAASTFSIEDASSTTQLTTFPLSDVVVYPEAASITMDEAYTEKQSGFGNGGTTSNPFYAVTNVASNITSSFNFGDGRQNYLFFHAPAREKTALSISAEHKAKTGVNIRTIITLVKGNKTKLELWAGPAGKTSKITDYEFDRNNQKVEFKIDEYSFALTAVTEGAEVVYEIRRGNYNEGDDCVFALSTFYVHGTPDVLKLTASQLVAPLGTPVKLSAIYREPVTQQRLHCYGQTGGGNDVLIDDIQFEICRPAVGLVAETLDGKKFDDIKNVRTQKCGDNVTLIADPEKNFMDIFPIPQGCAYFMWLQSEDGETWDQLKVDDQPWAGYGNCAGLSIDYAKAGVATIENKPMYYKALIGLSEREVGLYWRDPESEPCASVVETPAAYVYCSSLKLTIEKEKCNEYEAEVENPESGHTFKWEYGNENCGWTVIEGQTSVELKFDAKAYFDLLNKEKSAASADCCELGIRVTDNTSGDMAIGYVNTVYVTSLVAELLSQEDCMSKYRLTAEIKDACYGEPMGELYEFYKDGQKIDRCEDNNDGNGDDTYQRPARGASRTVVIDNNPNISINRSVTGYDDSAEPSDCDWDPEYITEGLINGATYTVKFGGDDDMMYCESTVNITAGCDIMWPTIITPYAKENLNDLFIPFYCADKSNDGKCNRSINFPEENIVSIKVFDRSGNMVAETTKAGWSGVSGDGTNFVMPGVYYYVAVCTVDGQDQTYRGTIEVFNELKTEKK